MSDKDFSSKKRKIRQTKGGEDAENPVETTIVGVRHNKRKPKAHYLFSLSPEIWETYFKNPNHHIVVWSDWYDRYLTDPALGYEHLKTVLIHILSSNIHGENKYTFIADGKWEDVARVFEFGANKYAKHNWRNGLQFSETLDSLGRHLLKMMAGEVIDSESRLPHIGHYRWNALALMHMFEQHPELNDL